MSNHIIQKVKKGIPQLIIKSQKGQQLCERELYAINTNEVSGMVPMAVERKGSGFQLVYDLSGYVPLIQFLAEPIRKGIFVSILDSILENLRAVKNAVFHEASLWLDPGFMFLDPQTQQTVFIYVPISGYDCGTDLRQMLLGLIQYCTFDQSEDLIYVSEYIEILNHGVNFSTFELEQYVNGLKGQILKANRPKKCPNCGHIGEAGFAFCSECGGALVEIESEEPPVAVSQTQKAVGAFLFRESTGERVLIDRPHFRIGKSVNNEYSLQELRTVSRSHAVIMTRDDRYFIMDLGSTNGTFVNDQEIPAQVETEVFHDTRIRLANEMFVFEIKD